jgi:hypothetical protein
MTPASQTLPGGHHPPISNPESCAARKADWSTPVCPPEITFVSFRMPADNLTEPKSIRFPLFLLSSLRFPGARSERGRIRPRLSEEHPEDVPFPAEGNFSKKLNQNCKATAPVGDPDSGSRRVRPTIRKSSRTAQPKIQVERSTRSRLQLGNDELTTRFTSSLAYR